MSTFPHGNLNVAALKQQIQALGEWFHNLDLHGVATAPDHFLGDFPSVKWQRIAPEIPQDLRGATVLDVGCNGGFYSIQMKQRGADRVLGVDVDQRYLSQARFAAHTLGLEIEFQNLSVYHLDLIHEQFDYVLFMGVFYHLRYPLFALDTLLKKVKRCLIFQTMVRGSQNTREWQDDYSFWETQIFSQPDFPAVYFIENSYSNDRTNWWIPNCGAVEAILRSSGLEITSHPESETWICKPRNIVRQGQYVVDLEMQGLLPVEDEDIHG